MPSARTLAADLAAVVSDLDGYIERRAAEQAAPMIAAARQEADERVAEAAAQVQRGDDLVHELRRRLDALERQTAAWRTATGCRTPVEWRMRDTEPEPRYTCAHQASNFTPCRNGCHDGQSRAPGGMQAEPDQGRMPNDTTDISVCGYCRGLRGPCLCDTDCGARATAQGEAWCLRAVGYLDHLQATGCDYTDAELARLAERGYR